MSTLGVMGSLEVISKVEAFAPVDVGLNVTLMLKLLPGLIVLLPLPPVILNIDASVPVSDVYIRRLTVPLFVTLKEAVFLLFTLTFP